MNLFLPSIKISFDVFIFFSSVSFSLSNQCPLPVTLKISFPLISWASLHLLSDIFSTYFGFFLSVDFLTFWSVSLHIWITSSRFSYVMKTYMTIHLPLSLYLYTFLYMVDWGTLCLPVPLFTNFQLTPWFWGIKNLSSLVKIVSERKPTSFMLPNWVNICTPYIIRHFSSSQTYCVFSLICLVIDILL